jgi:hypothetical protein
MDVERIQKVNNLALDLMRQGLASTRDDAILQAEKIFQGKETEEYSSMKETLEEIKQDQKPQQQPELGQETIKNILEQNSNFLVKKIKEFQEKIELMEKEISFLKNRPVTSNQATVKEIVSNVPPPVEQTQQQPPAQQEQKADPTMNHPRSGNYKDTDVSIEKFFYMGSK